MPYYIAFDGAHKPRGKIDENYSELRNYLNSNGFFCENFLEFPITRDSLKVYDILVFACPDFAKITSQEITDIETWINQEGGGLLLLSHAGGDRGRNSNLSELSQRFGIVFENDQVLDHENNLGMENVPIISRQNFNPPHPITDGIESIAYRAGCSLSVVGNAFAIASSNDTSDPFSSPIICVKALEKGRACCIGSYEMFRNQIGGGLKYPEHPKFVLNLFNWLVSDYRIELKSIKEVSEIKPPISPSQPSETEQEAPTIEPVSIEKHPIAIDFAIKVSNKSELMDLLKVLSNQIDTIKNIIDDLIKQVSASEEEIFELKKEQASQRSDLDKRSISLKENDFDVSRISKNTPDDDFKKQPPSSAVPKEPPVLFESESSTKKRGIGLPISEDSSDQNTKSKTDSASKSNLKEDLKAEKQGLEEKIDSVNELLRFIEKKRESGTLDVNSYEKQANQLKKDIRVAKKRIEEINKIL